MLLNVLIYVSLFGAIALAIFSVYKRVKNKDNGVAGYVFNGKKWVTWLLMLCILAVLFLTFVMPIPALSGMPTYRPEWKFLLLALFAIVLYICYAIIAFVPASPAEIESNRAAGNTVMENLGETSATMFSSILAIIGSILLALPGMISSVLNPVLAVKTIGNTVYKVIGTGFSHIIGGILALAVIIILVFLIIYVASLILALIGTFAIGIIAIVKFVMNNVRKGGSMDSGLSPEVTEE